MFNCTAIMDCGYFMGCGEGLIWFPPAGSEDRTPVIIPWDEVLDEENSDN